jgi:23S rRNA (cytosine1962-C5)-methyltransferase
LATTMRREFARLVLKPGRERPLLRHHPWVFSGAIDRVEGDPGLGETVDLISADGDWLARAAYSPHSQIRARIWSWREEDVGRAFFARRLAAALQAREQLGLPAVADAFRLVHAESDGLPGLVVDRYADWIVVQFLTAGAEAWRDELLSLLAARVGKRIYERPDSTARSLEGLAERAGTPVDGQPPARLPIHEHGLAFLADLAQGQKTGFYLDQRENRRRARSLARGARALDAFCYTGAFSVSLLAGGAQHVVAVDASEHALAGVREHVELNGLDSGRLDVEQGNVFKQLSRTHV